jgi:hypothetical protein
MQVAIMQPYFLPYIGYFQLIAAADVFVIYDSIKYTKKGWINRNRFLLNGQDALFSLPLEKASDACTVVERQLSEQFDRDSLLRQLLGAYAQAPYYESTRILLNEIIHFPDNNLFRYIHHAVTCVCMHIGIATPILVSSSVPADHLARGQDKVLGICKALQADHYVNAIGGTELYSCTDFAAHGTTLRFLQPRLFVYPQFTQPFVPWLSIVDVLMFNAPQAVHSQITAGYDLVRGVP